MREDLIYFGDEILPPSEALALMLRAGYPEAVAERLIATAPSAGFASSDWEGYTGGPKKGRTPNYVGKRGRNAGRPGHKSPGGHIEWLDEGAPATRPPSAAAASASQAPPPQTALGQAAAASVGGALDRAAAYRPDPQLPVKAADSARELGYHLRSYLQGEKAARERGDADAEAGWDRTHAFLRGLDRIMGDMPAAHAAATWEALQKSHPDLTAPAREGHVDEGGQPYFGPVRNKEELKGSLHLLAVHHRGEDEDWESSLPGMWVGGVRHIGKMLGFSEDEKTRKRRKGKKKGKKPRLSSEALAALHAGIAVNQAQALSFARKKLADPQVQLLAQDMAPRKKRLAVRDAHVIFDGVAQDPRDVLAQLVAAGVKESAAMRCIASLPAVFARGERQGADGWTYYEGKGGQPRRKKMVRGKMRYDDAPEPEPQRARSDIERLADEVEDDPSDTHARRVLANALEERNQPGDADAARAHREQADSDDEVARQLNDPAVRQRLRDITADPGVPPGPAWMPPDNRGFFQKVGSAIGIEPDADPHLDVWHAVGPHLVLVHSDTGTVLDAYHDASRAGLKDDSDQLQAEFRKRVVGTDAGALMDQARAAGQPVRDILLSPAQRERFDRLNAMSWQRYGRGATISMRPDVALENLKDGHFNDVTARAGWRPHMRWRYYG